METTKTDSLIMSLDATPDRIVAMRVFRGKAMQGGLSCQLLAG